MTLAPRVEVYTQLACRAIHGKDPVNPNATALSSSLLSYFPSSYAIDHAENALVTAGNVARAYVGLDRGEDDEESWVTVEWPESGIVDAATVAACKGDPRVQGRAARIQACTYDHSALYLFLLLADYGGSCLQR